MTGDIPSFRVPCAGTEMNVRTAGSGPWTIVLDGGWLQWSPLWARVQESLAQHHRTVAIDRLGLGESGRGPMPRSAYQIVDELQEALAVLEVEGPLIAVGAGFGAVHARVLAHRESSVRGLVLVDPVVEVLARTKRFSSYRDRLDAELQKNWGPFKALLQDWPGGMRGLPKAAALAIRTQLSSENLFAMRAELGALEESIQQLATLGRPAIPCGVLSRPRSDISFAQAGSSEDASVTMQRKLAEQSEGGLHEVVDAKRFLPIAAPDAVVRIVEQLTQQDPEHAPTTSPGGPPLGVE
ncbi:MAG: alpha/beta hydrolase [Myxococcota bacterium]